MSFGERLSVRFISFLLNKVYKVPAQHFDAWDIGMITTAGTGSASSCASNAEILPTSAGEINRNLNDPKVCLPGAIAIVTGELLLCVEADVFRPLP